MNCALHKTSIRTCGPARYVHLTRVTESQLAKRFRELIRHVAGTQQHRVHKCAVHVRARRRASASHAHAIAAGHGALNEGRVVTQVAHEHEICTSMQMCVPKILLEHACASPCLRACSSVLAPQRASRV